jgi:hypothetical protein
MCETHREGKDLMECIKKSIVSVTIHLIEQPQTIYEQRSMPLSISLA